MRSLVQHALVKSYLAQNTSLWHPYSAFKSFLLSPWLFHSTHTSFLLTHSTHWSNVLVALSISLLTTFLKAACFLSVDKTWLIWSTNLNQNTLPNNICIFTWALWTLRKRENFKHRSRIFLGDRFGQEETCHAFKSYSTGDCLLQQIEHWLWTFWLK